MVGYYVYRSFQSGGPYTKLNLVPLDDITYTDSTVTAYLTYYYVATSVDENGLESVFSNEASATVPGP